MIDFIDMMGEKVKLSGTPLRIVSLVPSQTEYLYALGLADRVVGVTKFCVHPAHARQQATIVGGSKNFHIERIKSLQPDLILGNKEENDEPLILALQKEFPIWMSDISTLEDALIMMEQIALMTNKQKEGDSIIDLIKNAFKDLPVPKDSSPSVVYLIWKDPWMGVGNQTFIHDMLQRAGFRNLLSHKERYPILSMEEIAQLNPQWIFLSSEPYPFSEKHCIELHAALPHQRITVVNGEYFSWYGSRLLEAATYFKDLAGSFAI